MNDQLKQFQAAVSKIFVAEGFVKHGVATYLNGGDTHVVSHVRRDVYSDYLYFNVAIWIKALGVTVWPKPNVCHIQTNAEFLLPEIKSELLEICDFVNKTRWPDGDRIKHADHLLRTSIIPRYRVFLNLNELKKYWSAGAFSNALVFKEARTLMEEDSTTERLRR